MAQGSQRAKSVKSRAMHGVLTEIVLVMAVAVFTGDP
jgi:hypothetical protein